MHPEKQLIDLGLHREEGLKTHRKLNIEIIEPITFRLKGLYFSVFYRFAMQWSVELMALSSIDRMNGGVCLDTFIYYKRKAFMVKFVHENDDREYIKVMERKNLERFKHRWRGGYRNILSKKEKGG
ncbi:hypothetical protein CAPTEDRAFT_187283 [Capitella teleta]|uniref:Uncharacterized protein n=1 Tax=Capitella teleta TaxID=283909 RepID=X1ZK38_CAPTE|nr:hypothetical protein CAPTEDRAFT_187283 [Capitella teleta]|eukprot:ELU10118.1 hypothetical protein CAPTEDRAFT_187283 [Capitella teleta]